MKKIKNWKIIIISSLILLMIILIILIKNNYNFSKKGNNITNKSADEIEKYILNIESYQARVQIVIKSNKNENKYIMLQKYNKENNIYLQEIIEPENIAGTRFIYDGQNLKIENTKLNLNKIYENYSYIESHELSLPAFIQDYKENDKSSFYEKENTVILETEVKTENKYTSKKKLYINKEKGKIEKMEIEDNTQNIRIYILYNEIEINDLETEEIVAFSINEIKTNI